MNIFDIHRTKGKICSYAIKCEGDEKHEFYVYCGHTAKDLEYRMLQHSGGAPGGAVFTKAHPPTGEILSVCVHQTVEDAMAAECALWNLWIGKLGDYDRVRGARYNGIQSLKYHPRGWGKEIKV